MKEIENATNKIGCERHVQFKFAIQKKPNKFHVFALKLRKNALRLNISLHCCLNADARGTKKNG